MDILRSGKSLRACLTVIVAVLAVGSVSTVVAVPPDKVYFGPVQAFGFAVGDCGDFVVLNDYTVEGFFIVHFDQDGFLTHVNQHISFSDSTYYNSEDPDVRINGGPAELENDRFDFTSDRPVLAVSGIFFKITLPGYGLIFHEAGRAILDLETNEVLFQAGPADVSEGNLAALCAALTP